MDELLKYRSVIALITAIVSITTTFIGQDARYGPQIEQLSRESERQSSRISSLEEEKSILQSRYSGLENEYIELQNSYNIIYAKYQKCISSNGALYQVGSLDFNNVYTREFKTGDILEFEMTATPIDILIKRISKSGPVIVINGCEYYLTENGINSANEGRHTYYLSTEYPFKLKYSAKSCKEGNASMVDYETEEIFLKVLSYNVDEQKTKIKYYRELYQK